MADAPKCATCGGTLPSPGADCRRCLTEAVQETIAEELALFRVLIVADREAGDALRRHEHTAMPDARLVVVDDPTAPLTEADGLVLHAADSGKLVRTWCAPTDAGRRVAREVARTLDPVLQNGAAANGAGAAGRVLHVTAVDPRDWQPLVARFDALVGGARATLPALRSARRSGGEHGTEPPPFDTSPAEIARRVVQRFGAELLIVAPPQHEPTAYSTGYALDGNGLWCAGGDPWARWMVQVAETMTFDAATSGLHGKALSAALSAINRIKRPGMVDQVRPMLRAMLDTLRTTGEPCRDVTECRAEDLDANLRYIGAANGVVDLHTGTLLSPDRGRRCLVTSRCAVPYDLGAQHPAVDRLFAHLSPDAAAWWWAVLGRALRGPTKHLYAAVGEPNGGKTTLLNALRETLGPYARKAARGVLSASNRTSETQLTPGLLAWMSPARFVLIEEEKRRQTLDAGLVKDLTGGGTLAARGMRENLREGRVQATTFLFANTDSVPRLSLETEGMRDRYRELSYPPVAGKLDPTLRDQTTTDPAFQTALLARLVACSAQTPDVPDDIPLVREATAERIREDLGEIGEFARRVVVGGGGVLAFGEVWQAWCEHNGEAIDAKEPGGIGKRRLTGALRDHVRDLPAPRQVRVGGSNARGWRGWRLLTPDEVPEAAAAAPSDAAEAKRQAVLRSLLRDAALSSIEQRGAHVWEEVLLLTKPRPDSADTPEFPNWPDLPGLDEPERERLDEAEQRTGGLW